MSKRRVVLTVFREKVEVRRSCESRKCIAFYEAVCALGIDAGLLRLGDNKHVIEEEYIASTQGKDC